MVTNQDLNPRPVNHKSLYTKVVGEVNVTAAVEHVCTSVFRCRRYLYSSWQYLSSTTAYLVTTGINTWASFTVLSHLSSVYLLSVTKVIPQYYTWASYTVLSHLSSVYLLSVTKVSPQYYTWASFTVLSHLSSVYLLSVTKVIPQYYTWASFTVLSHLSSVYLLSVTKVIPQ